jgi:hypothetical protein
VVRRFLGFVLLYSFDYDSCFCLLIEVTDPVLKRNVQLRQANEPLLRPIDVVPHLVHVFTGHRDPHALNSSHEVGLAYLAFTSLVHKSEDVRDVTVLVLHSSEH